MGHRPHSTQAFGRGCLPGATLERKRAAVTRLTRPQRAAASRVYASTANCERWRRSFEPSPQLTLTCSATSPPAELLLPRISDCAETDALAQRPPVPTDARRRAQLDEVTERTAEVGALLATGRIGESERSAGELRRPDRTGRTPANQGRRAAGAGRSCSRTGGQRGPHRGAVGRSLHSPSKRANRASARGFGSTSPRRTRGSATRRRRHSRFRPRGVSQAH